MSITINGQTSPATEFAWNQSCPLRFINNWALDKNYVPQCYEKPVTIEAR